MEPVKLERLLIQEVSGVDDPANELPGWMVTKSASGNASAALLLGVAAEMETLTKASDSKQPYGDVKYADPGYQKDGKKRYPLDTETHVRAAWSYINQADNASLYTAEQLASIKAKIKAAMKDIGATTEDEDSSSTTKGTAESIVAKIKGILLGAPREEIEMEKDELVAAIVEGNEPLVKAVTDAVSKSVAPTEGATTEETKATEADATQVAAVTKAVTDYLDEHVVKQYNEILEKAFIRIEAVETHLGVAARKSLDGQETTEAGEPVVKKAPDLGDAIAAAFKR